MNFTTFNQRFHSECENLDPLHDTFSRVIDRTNAGNGGPPLDLKHRELTTLHATYLRGLSGALRLLVPLLPANP